jgi:uncharacterized protein YkwD
MAPPRRILAVLALALLCSLPAQAASAQTRRVAHHKQSRVCKRARHHRKQRRGCGKSAKQKTRHSHTAARRERSGTLTGPRGASRAALAQKRMSAAATIASVLATPCADTQLIPAAENLQLIREATLCLINQERARSGESPLQVNEQLERAAQSHTDSMVSENYFSHTAPDGETPLQRVRATGYLSSQTYTIGENAGWATLNLATPQAMVEAWIASPEHLANILEAKFRDTAIGIAPAAPAAYSEGNPGATYTQEFGFVETAQEANENDR